MSYNNNINLPPGTESVWVLNYFGSHRVYKKEAQLKTQIKRIKKWTPNSEIQVYKLKLDWEKVDNYGDDCC